MAAPRDFATEKKDLADVFRAVTARGEKQPPIEDNVTQYALGNLQLSQFPTFSILVDFANSGGSVTEDKDGKVDFTGTMTPQHLHSLAEKIRNQPKP